ncbi:MAG: pseudouridine synthase [Bacilli bacterium]|nr:pseudouridine synthase [Bacilli bacterium]
MIRLQKRIADSGYASRRKAEELIKDGKVTVNDKIVTEMGVLVKDSDTIEVEGTTLSGNEEKVYYLMYKPASVITSTEDDKKRKTVIDLIKVDKRVYPVGRLDYDTTGALLLTNDGELANMIMHPSNKIDKIYRVKVKGLIKVEAINKLTQGVIIDGVKSSKAKVKLRSYNKKNNTSILNITIHEGRNHQIKKMLMAVGFDVIKLKRESIGFLDLTGLKPGEYRKLTVKEVKTLYSMKN